MSYNKSLFWFRANLRLEDNLALKQAMDDSLEVVLLYVHDKRHQDKNILGNSRSSEMKQSFLWQAVKDLHLNIERKGGSLLIKEGHTVEEVRKTFDEHGCEAIYTTIEAGTEESRDLLDIEEYLMKHGKALKSFSQNTLYHPEDIPWPINKLPAVFTQFRKENEKQTEVRPLSDELSSLEKAFNSGFTKAAELTAYDKLSETIFSGGETAALKRLEYYLWESDLVKTYKETRNGLIGKDFSSKLSAYLATGCISPKTIYFELKKYEHERGSNQSTYWLFFELVWRDYFHFILKKHGKDLFSISGIKEDDFQWSRDQTLFEKWSNASTGVPFIDANMRELNTTGYMSNRGRQLVASFLTHDLEIDWRWGAWYFEEKLLDYDVASNWGNWAYVAGVGNDPRENRYFNILSQAKRYDNKGDYIRKWIPELNSIQGFDVHRVSLLAEQVVEELPRDADLYKNPIVDIKKWDH